MLKMNLVTILYFREDFINSWGQFFSYIFAATYLQVLRPTLAVLPSFLVASFYKLSFFWFLNLRLQELSRACTDHLRVTKSLLIENLSHLLIESPWRRLNSAPVCFGAKNNTFGRFKVEFSGSINAVKLVHLDGKVSCGKAWAKWGCNPGRKKLRVFITDASNTIIIPKPEGGSYEIPGYNSSSSEIIITDIPNPLYLSSGQDLRLWFGYDLFDHDEDDNNGTVCTNVFVRYL